MGHHRGPGRGVFLGRGRERQSCARCSPSATRSSRSTQLPGRRSHAVRRGRAATFRQRGGCASSLVWHEVPLNLSFRSTEPMLKAVDEVFGKRRRPPTGSSGRRARSSSITPFRTGQAGLVELWEVETETEADPVRSVRAVERGAGRRLARSMRCAGASPGRSTPGSAMRTARSQRPHGIRAGDILILVRRRDPFTAPMIRALKRREACRWRAPTACSLLEQLAVQDLVALADVLLMPEDDLALAVVLKSPLFGFDDDDLFDSRLRARRASLWTALKPRPSDDPRFADGGRDSRAVALPRRLAAALRILLRAARRRGPDACAERMLTRLGPEAAEAIDEFLDLALAYDRERRTVAARLRQSAARRRRRDQARHGAEARRGAHHDGAWRQGPAGADRDSCRTPACGRGCKGRGSIPCRARASRRTRSAISCGRRRANQACGYRGRPRASVDASGAPRNITGCSMSP